MPAHNAEATIAESLRSAIVQTWQRKEIVVIDDGSTDRTAEIARGFSSKNVRVVSTENRGMCAAVNLALSISQGDYIQELDSDDILVADKIERQLAALGSADKQENPRFFVLGSLLSPHARVAFRSELTVPGSFASRMALAEVGRKPPYAECDLAGQSGVGLRGGSVGYPASLRPGRRILCSGPHGV